MINDKSSRRWFEEAARSQIEHHQGCPWCGRSHCVYHVIRGKLRVYSCQLCDFQASYNEATGEYSHVIGEGQKAQQKTTVH